MTYHPITAVPRSRCSGGSHPTTETELGQRMVFIGGLHRSGTTPLARCLAAHPDVSGFSDTGVEEDEGQHLQKVYPPASAFGGPGRFARRAGAHLTEDSPLASDLSAAQLWQSWSPHWDLDRRILLEKSPPNLVQTRFLHRLFPEASFVMIMRHPVVVTLSTAKWARRTPLPRVMDNWFAAHDTFSRDLRNVPRVKVITYEALTRRPQETLAEVGDFLGLDGDIPHHLLQGDRSSGYEQRWREMATSRNPLARASHRYMVARYGDRARGYGYDLMDLEFEGGAASLLP
jgi:hypothetical protein